MDHLVRDHPDRNGGTHPVTMTCAAVSFTFPFAHRSCLSVWG